MENLEECMIDEEFKNQLENATSQTPLTVIATIRETPEVRDAFNKSGKGYRKSTPEERQAITEAETRMMEPVCKYLDWLGIRYNNMKSIHVISAQMTPQQILEFMKQPYVQIICPDQPIFLVE